MSFENPIWLYLAPAAALGAGALIAFGLRQHAQLLQKFAAERLLPSLTERLPCDAPSSKLHSSSSAWLCWECALAAPVWRQMVRAKGSKPRPRLRSGQLKKHASFGHPPHTARSSRSLQSEISWSDWKAIESGS